MLIKKAASFWLLLVWSAANCMIADIPSPALPQTLALRCLRSTSQMVANLVG